MKTKRKPKAKARRSAPRQESLRAKSARARRKTAKQETTRDVLTRLFGIFADVPAEEWKKLPRDGATNLDHYLYGAPKRES